MPATTAGHIYVQSNNLFNNCIYILYITIAVSGNKFTAEIPWDSCNLRDLDSFDALTLPTRKSAIHSVGDSFNLISHKLTHKYCSQLLKIV